MKYLYICFCFYCNPSLNRSNNGIEMKDTARVVFIFSARQTESPLSPQKLFKYPADDETSLQVNVVLQCNGDN